MLLSATLGLITVATNTKHRHKEDGHVASSESVVLLCVIISTFSSGRALSLARVRALGWELVNVVVYLCDENWLMSGVAE